MHSINLPPETAIVANTVLRSTRGFPARPRRRGTPANRGPHLFPRFHLRFAVPCDVSLSTRLMLLVLAGVIPLLICNLATVYGDFRDDRARAFQQTMLLSRAIARSTEAFLNTRIADLEVLIDSPALQAGDLNTFRGKAERAVQHQFPGNTLVLTRRDGTQLIHAGALADVQLPDRGPLASPNQALDIPLPSVSGVFVPAGATAPVVAIAVPVDRVGEATGLMLTLYVSLRAFAALVEQERPGDGWIIAIIDQNGRRVARIPAAGLVGQPVTRGAPDPWPTRQEAMFEGKSPQGVPVLAAYSSLPHFAWRASVAVPTELLTAPAWRSALSSVSAALVLLLFGSFLARRIARGITGPFAKLQQIAVAPDNDGFDGGIAATGLREADEVANVLIAEKRSRSEATAGLEQALMQRTAALGQRDLLLREVYHRVKNNLQLVDSLLALQIGQTTSREAVGALSDLRSRVYALGLVHQQLMTSADLKTFDIAPFLHQLRDNIRAARGGSCGAVHVEAAAITVTLDFAIPLALLVNELITNCFKHSQPQGCAEVSVRLVRDPVGDLLLTVASTRSHAPGAECAQSLTATCASSYAHGLGVEIVMGLTAQIDGVMNVCEADAYTTEIRIPAARIPRD